MNTTKFLWVFLIWLILWIVWTWIFSWLSSSWSEELTSSFWVQSYEEEQAMPEKWVIVDREIYDGTCHNIEELTSCISEWTSYSECAKLSKSSRCESFLSELMQQHWAAWNNLVEKATEANNTFNWFWVWASKRTTGNNIPEKKEEAVCNIDFSYKLWNHMYTKDCVQQKCCDYCVWKKDEKYCSNPSKTEWVCVSKTCLDTFDLNWAEIFKAK